MTVPRTIYDDTHELFRGTAREFALREIVPNFERWEREGVVDRALFRKAGDAGLLGMAIPEEYGGGGTDDFRFNAIRIEEFARAGVLTGGLGLGLHSDIVLPYYLEFADADQRARWLPGLASGELIGAIAMSEPGTGSDIAAVQTRALRDGDHYVVNGSKIFISNGILSDVVVVVCRTGTEGSKGLSLLVVERGTEGFRRGRNLDKIGVHSQDTAELFFDDVRVPVANRLGDEHAGFHYLMRGLAQERLQVAVGAIAEAEAVFATTLEYAKERHAFGQPIASFQNSRFVLATMRTELDVARIYIDRLVLAHVEGELSSEDAAEAKWWTTDLQNSVADRCLQMHGGYGYLEEYAIARHWRDCRVNRIAAGSNEIMKELIGRRVLGV